MNGELRRCLLAPRAPEYVHLELTYRCNCRCSFCYNPLLPSTELKTEEVKEVVDNLVSAGVFGVNLTGGEPLIRSDFFEILEYAGEKGLRLHLNTNATFLTRSKCEKLVGLIQHVCVTLLASSAETHDRLTNCPGSFRLAIQGIENLVKVGMQVQVHMTVTRENLFDIRATGALVKALGCSWFLASRVAPIGRAKDDTSACLDIEDIETMLGALEDIELQERLRVAIPSPIPLCLVPNHRDNLIRWNIKCNVGFMLACVSPDATVRPCTLYPQNDGNALTTPFTELWSSKMFQSFRNLEHIPDRCTNCKFFIDCRTGCRAVGSCVAGVLNAPDPLLISRNRT